MPTFLSFGRFEILFKFFVLGSGSGWAAWQAGHSFKDNRNVLFAILISGSFNTKSRTDFVQISAVRQTVSLSRIPCIYPHAEHFQLYAFSYYSAALYMNIFWTCNDSRRQSSYLDLCTRVPMYLEFVFHFPTPTHTLLDLDIMDSTHCHLLALLDIVIPVLYFLLMGFIYLFGTLLFDVKLTRGMMHGCAFYLFWILLLTR